jgi:hypothetical protein
MLVHEDAARTVDAAEVGLQRLVVAEPLRLLVRVDVTADPREQGDVVEVRPLGLVQAQALGQPERDEGLTENVLHRLPEAQIRSQGESGDQLGEPETRFSIGLHLRAEYSRARWRGARRRLV